MIEVTNLSRRPVKLISVYWRALWQKAVFVQITGAHPRSASLPTKVEADGGTANFIFPEKTYLHANNIDFVRRLFGVRFARFLSRFVRIGVATSLGKRFERRIDPSLAGWFIQLAHRSEKDHSN